ncbi:MAG: DUF302 domain-containing protein [Deltaproteobacteria bacterium]|nr:DUF302 domain-containing protein [Deltaproteobacteria bacterium]
MGKMILGSHPEAGLENPAKLYVFERGDGKTVVSYYKPSGGFATYRADSLRQVGQMMDQVLAEIAAEGTR